ncbi:MAG: hypothetical protein KF745_10870 [Phycisphaeraceae bacterium]|nr:hypothetical protein [Phycisphaeraceae bacterium]
MPLRTVLILGDSHRLAYQPCLTEILLEDRLTLVGPAQSCGSAAAMADTIPEWLVQFDPDLGVFACPPIAAEDLARSKDDDDGPPWPSFSLYESTVLRIAELVRRHCGRQTLFVPTPPVDDRRFGSAASQANRTIVQFNHVATTLLAQLNVASASLHHDLARAEADCFAEDGVTLSPAGNELAAASVATGIHGLMRA